MFNKLLMPLDLRIDFRVRVLPEEPFFFSGLLNLLCIAP
jgi:hypothetical protein